MSLSLLLLLLLPPVSLLAPCIGPVAAAAATTASSAQIEDGFELVTYHSVVKLANVATGYRLHSQEVAYGTGSQQQSVSAFANGHHDGSFWLLKGAHLPPPSSSRQPQQPQQQQSERDDAHRERSGQPVRCDDVIRLEHVQTRRNLHSHLVRSPMSGQQEVSAFSRRDGNNDNDDDGRGDSGDNWQVVCAGARSAPKDQAWRRDTPVYLRHVDTPDAYLSTQSKLRFGTPIAGQLEVSCRGKRSENEQWRVQEGYFIAPSDR